jgi:hypothetical protein
MNRLLGGLLPVMAMACTTHLDVEAERAQPYGCTTSSLALTSNSAPT